MGCTKIRGTLLVENQVPNGGVSSTSWYSLQLEVELSKTLLSSARGMNGQLETVPSIRWEFDMWKASCYATKRERSTIYPLDLWHLWSARVVISNDRRQQSRLLDKHVPIYIDGGKWGGERINNDAAWSELYEPGVKANREYVQSKRYLLTGNELWIHWIWYDCEVMEHECTTKVTSWCIHMSTGNK